MNSKLWKFIKKIMKILIFQYKVLDVIKRWYELMVNKPPNMNDFKAILSKLTFIRVIF